MGDVNHVEQSEVYQDGRKLEEDRVILLMGLCSWGQCIVGFPIRATEMKRVSFHSSHPPSRRRHIEVLKCGCIISDNTHTHTHTHAFNKMEFVLM